MKFKNKYKKYICNRKLIPYIIVLTILLLSVGYSAFSSNLSIRDLYAEVRLEKDVRITGISVASHTESTTTYIDYNISNIQAGINLPNENSSVTFNVMVTNIGSIEVGIKDIIGLPGNLEYEILNYSLKDKICNENNECKLGIQKEIQVQIKYKEGYYDSSNTQYNVVGNFNFQPYYTVSYEDIEGEGYPKEVIGGDTLILNFGDNAPNNIKVKMNNVEITNYTYECGVLTIPNVSGNVKIFTPLPSFAEDDWSTIVANVQSGNLSAYKVGDTKEIALTGFTNGEEGSNGLYTIRIANTTSPTECSTSGFSQTACGFVIEFVDIITTHAMNPTMTNVGGWEASEMRTYVNSTIYESLPEELKTNIIDTYVVSGHGSTSGETNFKTTDKIYLLSTKEVWGKEGTSNTIKYDTGETETRQLDYYKSIGVTTNSYTGAIKKLNGSANYWWLRSANSTITNRFCSVSNGGDWYASNATRTRGVAVAFRIG